jgi:site-specific DNA-methyltransferase (adenine-specific)
VTYSKANPNNKALFGYGTETLTKGNSDWEGWGTALKPAHEPIVMARKPLVGTVADNVLEYGVGGINIDGCRVGNETITQRQYDRTPEHGGQWGNSSKRETNGVITETEGRFPANIILDEEAGRILDEQSGERKGWADQNHNSFNPYGGNSLNESNTQRDGIHKGYNDNGGASRFFYCPKASKKDRDEGLDTFKENKRKLWDGNEEQNSIGKLYPDGTNRPEYKLKNIHPTVKPTDLMGYLIRLVTPKGGVVLDPFMGSGSTGKAAVREGMEFIGIEREEEYYEIAKQRIENETNKRKFW